MGGERLRPARILVIEDGAEEQFILQTLLEFHDYSVLLASDGARGLELARQHRPDLIILDLALPRLSGIDVANTLRASRDLADVPIVVVTAFPDLYMGHMRQLGIPWHEKPVDPSILLATIRRELAKESGRRDRTLAKEPNGQGREVPS